MITRSRLIATVVEDLLEKWSCAKVHIAKDNGFIRTVLRKKIFHKNGTALSVRNKNKKLEIPIQEAFLSIKKVLDIVIYFTSDFTFKNKSIKF